MTDSPSLADRPTYPFEEEPAPALAFEDGELLRALLKPHIALEITLAGARRLTANVVESRALPAAAGLLIAVSIFAALPYGFVVPGLPDSVTALGSSWRVAALFGGSLAICFPALHVFSQFLGCRFGFFQNLVLALMFSSVAAAFSFGFAPIIWFIDTTTESPANALIRPEGLSATLLTLSLLMGLVQMLRCLRTRGSQAGSARLFLCLIAAWLVLLLFITRRMGVVLELW